MTLDGVAAGALVKESPVPSFARRGGRPTKADAGQLGQKIVDIAAAMFLAEGYGAVSIEAIAKQAQISKRTFYHRFPDKAALFRAVVHDIVEKLRPPVTPPLFEGKSIEEILGRLARLMAHAAVNPAALALHRLVIAEALRFPELATVVAEEGARTEAITLLCGILLRETASDRRTESELAVAAEQFMQLVMAIPQRRALGLGTPMTPGELDRWADNAVALFLEGFRGRPA